MSCLHFKVKMLDKCNDKKPPKRANPADERCNMLFPKAGSALSCLFMASVTNLQSLVNLSAAECPRVCSR